LATATANSSRALEQPLETLLVTLGNLEDYCELIEL